MELLERWVAELQLEVERLGAAMEVLCTACSRLGDEEATAVAAAPMPAEPRAEHSVVVLGPGCKRCETLFESTRRLIDELQPGSVSVRHVTDLDEIAEYGIVLTPALVVNDTILVSGRVPTEKKLRSMLTKALER